MTEPQWSRSQLAGFWLRAAAVAVDGLIAVTVLVVVLLVLPGVAAALGLLEGATLIAGVGLWVLGLLLYDVLMTAGVGGTLGKRAAGIEVRALDGERLDAGPAFLRSLARVVSTAVVLLGLIWVAFDGRRQGWHDKLVGSVVVRRRMLPPVLRDPDAPWWAAVRQPQLPATTGGDAVGAPAGTPAAASTAAGVAAQQSATPEPATERTLEPAEPAAAPVGGQQADEPPRAAPEAAHAADEATFEAAPQAAQGSPRTGAAGSVLGGHEPEAPETAAATAFATPDEGPPSRLDDTGAPEAGEPEPIEPEPAAAPAEPDEEPATPEEPPAEAPEPLAPAGASMFGELFDDRPAAEDEPAAAEEPAGAEEPAADAVEAPLGTAEPETPPRAEPAPAPEPASQLEPAPEPEPERATEQPGHGPSAAGRAAATDPNMVAIERSGIAPDAGAWLEQVAAQVDPRLDQVEASWRESEQAPAARACAFGLLLGHLATIYPHMRDDLHRVAESHPSFSTLLAGSRLATLQQIAGDPARAAAWLGPLIGAEDPERVGRLLQ